MVVAGLLLATFGVQRRRILALRRHNTRLEALKAERERALERVQRGQAKLESAYEGIRSLATRLESAEEQERRRISHELHDELGQRLTAAKLNLQMLRQAEGAGPTAEGLGEAVGMIDGMIDQVRDISLSLRPPLLDEAGLVPALEHYLQTVAARSGTAIEFELLRELRSAPPEVSGVVFRVVQEAVNNALRHADANRIDVRLDPSPAAIVVEISDDGRGFDPEAARARARSGQHLGLLGMAERVRSAGGELDLQSEPGVGSTVRARVPL
jgi:signal transduction histidine kinase